MKKVSVDQLDDLQEDMHEMMEDQEEMQEILGKDYGLDQYDEAELQAELEELDTDIVNEKLEGVVMVPSYMPQKAHATAKRETEELHQIMNQ